MASLKEKKPLERKFDELGPRIVIFDILPFYEAVVTGRVGGWSSEKRDQFKDDFSLFGYFRKDGLRNIWYFFTSIYFKLPCSDTFWSRRTFRHIYFDLLKIENLRIGLRCDEVLRQVASCSLNMYRLKKIGVGIWKRPADYFRWNTHHYRDQYDEDEPRASIKKIFSSENNFPRLERFVSTNFVHNSDSNRTLMDELDQRLYSVISHLKVLPSRELCLEPKFLEKHKVHLSNNLTRLQLHEVCFVKKTSLSFPHLKSLSLMNCFRLIITAGKNLKKLRYRQITDGFMSCNMTDMNCDCLREPMKDSNNIEKLYIAVNILEGTDWLFNKSFNPLSKLRVLSFFNYGHEYYGLSQRVNTFNFKLDELRIRGLEKDNFFLTSPFSESLKKLVLSSSGVVLERLSQIPFAKSLKELHVTLLRRNIHFRSTTFSSLECLELDESWPWDISGWKPMPNLRKVFLRTLRVKSDHFFREQDLSFLETIILINVEDITGRNWNPKKSKKKFQNLKNVILENCANFTDDFFAENNLNSVELVYIGNRMSKIAWKEWKLSKKCIVFLGSDFFGKRVEAMKKLREKNGVRFDRSGRDFESFLPYL